MMETNQFEKAIQSIKGALETIRKYNITTIKSGGVLYNNMASCFGSLNQLDSAKKYAQLGIEFARKNEDVAGEANGLFILGTAFEKQGKYAEALENFQKAQPIREKAGDPFFIVSDLAEISSLYARMGKTDEGIATSVKALKIAKENNLEAKLPMIYSALASNYETKGDFKNALKTYKILNELKDSIYNDANPKALAEMQTRYETEKKEQQILLQKSELELQQSELVRKNITLAAIIILALLGVLLLWSWFRRQQLKIRAARQAENIRQQELATKAVLEAEERERQRIAKDLHDGVGQIMSAAKMNLSAFENEILFTNPEQKLKFEKIIDLVDESCKEVRSVSHNMMPNALLKTGLTAAIREFIDKIDYSVLKVELSSEGLNERLDSNTETVLYRVIQECVNNVIKHSGANHLDISLIKDNEGISATIEDNGKGFDSKDNSKFEGIGLKNIRTRVEYLKGSVEFDSKPGKGTLVAIHIPAMTA
ncbi:MAG: sensor histidine kinase [Chitinophagaceae bacterium]|nr:sensor histidine kinase [Chitinophagaceae bacterium]